jgi:hypothetical protein
MKVSKTLQDIAIHGVRHKAWDRLSALCEVEGFYLDYFINYEIWLEEAQS